MNVATSAPISPSPSILTAPSVPDASVGAVASMRQVASLVNSVLHLETDYLTMSSQIDSAAGHARYAATLLKNDQSPNNDALIGLIEESVIAPLESPQQLQAGAAPFIATAATNIADSLALLISAG